MPTSRATSSSDTSCARRAKLIPALLMPVFILAGIYLGWFSPTEAGGFACVYAIARRPLRLSRACRGRTSSMPPIDLGGADRRKS